MARTTIAASTEREMTTAAGTDRFAVRGLMLPGLSAKLPGFRVGTALAVGSGGVVGAVTAPWPRGIG